MLPTKPSQTTTSAARLGTSLASMLPMKLRPLRSNISVVSETCLLPLPASAPTLSRATRGFSMPQKERANTAPMAPKLSIWAGRQSTLAPRSSMQVWGATPTTGPPSAGRSTPFASPRMTAAAAMVAPVEPMETQASAIPRLTRPVATRTDAFGFWRRASAGCSPSCMTPSLGTTRIGSLSAFSYWESSRSTASGSPTSRTIPRPAAANWTHPRTISDGALSPPIASTAIRTRLISEAKGRISWGSFVGG